MKKKTAKAARKTEPKCEKCKAVVPKGSHSCPLQREIWDSKDENYCNCCDNCAYECCMEI